MFKCCFICIYLYTLIRSPQPFWHQESPTFLIPQKTVFPWTGGGCALRDDSSKWITFIVHFISIIITSTLPQIIRYQIPEVGDPPFRYLDLFIYFKNVLRENKRFTWIGSIWAAGILQSLHEGTHMCVCTKCSINYLRNICDFFLVHLIYWGELCFLKPTDFITWHAV